MSSINSADRKNGDEKVRRARDQYQQSEAENLKKQKNEVRKLAEAHQAEIEALQQSHNKQLEDFKEKAKDSLTRRDMVYQKDMEDMREMHREQLRRLATEAESKGTRIEETYKGEMDRSQERAQRQRELLESNMKAELRQRDEKFADHAVKTRETMKEALVETKRSQAGAHEKEVKTLIKDRDQRIENAQMGYEELRKAKDQTIKGLQRNQTAQVDRLQTGFVTNLQNQQEDSQQRLELAREGFDAGIKENRNRYRKALEKETGAMENARGTLAETVTGRMSKKTMALEDQVYDLKRKRDRDQFVSEEKKKMEIKNVRDSFSRNIEDYERQRRDHVKASNENVSKEIKRVHSQHKDALTASNNFFEEKIGMDEVRNEERFSKAKSDFQTRFQNQEMSSNSRYEKMKSFNDLEREKMRAYFDQAASTMRENFDNTLREMRLRHKSEQDKLFGTFADQNREIEGKLQSKIHDITMKYEKQIAEMQEKHRKELKSNSDLAARQAKEMERKTKTDLETQNAQLSYRVAKNEESHKREMDELKRKHEDSLANLIKTRQS